MPTSTTADLSLSAIHQQEALVLGTRSPTAATNALTGNVSRVISVSAAATIPTTGASLIGAVDVTVTGAKIGDLVLVSAPSTAVVHMTCVTGSVIKADKVTLFGFADATGFTGVSQTYKIVLFRQS